MIWTLSITNNFMSLFTCGAARPTPLLLYMVSHISPIKLYKSEYSALISFPTFLSTGLPYATIGRTIYINNFKTYKFTAKLKLFGLISLDDLIALKVIYRSRECLKKKSPQKILCIYSWSIITAAISSTVFLLRRSFFFIPISIIACLANFEVYLSSTFFKGISGNSFFSFSIIALTSGVAWVSELSKFLGSPITNDSTSCCLQ